MVVGSEEPADGGQCGSQGSALSEGRRAACCPAGVCAFLPACSHVWSLVARKTGVVGTTEVGMSPLVGYRRAWG